MRKWFEVVLTVVIVCTLLLGATGCSASSYPPEYRKVYKASWTAEGECDSHDMSYKGHMVYTKKEFTSTAAKRKGLKADIKCGAPYRQDEPMEVHLYLKYFTLSNEVDGRELDISFRPDVWEDVPVGEWCLWDVYYGTFDPKTCTKHKPEN